MKDLGGFSLVLKHNDTCEGIKKDWELFQIYVVCNRPVIIIPNKGEAIMFEELLEKINIIEKNMALLLDLHMQQTNSLTTYKEVAIFLGKTKRTIYNYIKDSKLVANKHYYIDTNGKTIFIPEAIMEFKHSVMETHNDDKSKSILSTDITDPIADKLLQGVA